MGTVNQLAIEQFHEDLWKGEKMNIQPMNEITCEIKKKEIYYRPTLIFLAMLAETQDIFFFRPKHRAQPAKQS